MENDNILKKSEVGYGYKYTSLAAIAKQGIEIPKMKTGTENGREYVYYYDQDFEMWIRGAEIVLYDHKAMNKSQLYGSALTYARRYTVLLAYGLVCEDDQKLEKPEEVEQPEEVEKKIERRGRPLGSKNKKKEEAPAIPVGEAPAYVRSEGPRTSILDLPENEKMATFEQLSQLAEIVDDVEGMLRWCGVDELNKITFKQAEKIIAIKSRKKAEENVE